MCGEQIFFLSTMPSGDRISLQLREIISRLYLQYANTPGEIFAAIYQNNHELCSYDYLRKLCRKLRNPAFRESYLLGGPKSSGRPLSQSYFHRLLIRDSVLSNKTRRVCKMYKDYCAMFYPDDINIHGGGNHNPHMLSLSTFKRMLTLAQITRKVIERRNVNQNPIEGLEFLDAIEHINPIYFIDIDETKQDRLSRELKYGYAPEGEPCIKDQILINNVAYSTIAAVTPFGFMCWRIHEGNIDHHDFISFLTEEVSPHVLPSHHLVLDNATIHHAPETTVFLEEIFGGNYWFSAPYSPHLKPIEPCFALVKEWIRNHEDEATMDPVGTINSAFEMFSIGGERSDAIRGHWNGYFANYDFFLQNVNV